MSEVKYDTKKLDEVIKQLRDGYTIRVGILGGDGSKERGDNMDMAGLGAVHEFGSITKNIPARSFLRMPLEEHLTDALKNRSAGNDFEYYLKENKLKQWYNQIGLACLRIILSAFKTAGWGKWAKNSPYTVKQKGSSNPLVDTGALERSISYEVKHDTKR